MATEQANIPDAVVQVASEAARAEVQAMAMASAKTQSKSTECGAKLGEPIMKQMTFDWSSIDKYAELRNFKITAR